MKADPLDDILDDAMTRLERGEALDDILKRYPAHAAQLLPLLETAVAIRQADAVPFTRRGAIRARLSQAVRSGPAAPTFYSRLAGWLGPSPLWGVKTAQVVLVAVVVLVIGAAGTVAAASNSSPGDWLYPVKQVSHQVWTGIQTGLESRRRTPSPQPTASPGPSHTPLPTQTPHTGPADNHLSPIPSKPASPPDGVTPMPTAHLTVTWTRPFTPTWVPPLTTTRPAQPTWPRPSFTPVPTWRPIPTMPPHLPTTPESTPHRAPPPPSTRIPKPTDNP